MVGILEARAGFEHGAAFEIGPEFGLVQEGPAVGPLAAVIAVAHHSGGMRQ